MGGSQVQGMNGCPDLRTRSFQFILLFILFGMVLIAINSSEAEGEQTEGIAITDILVRHPVDFIKYDPNQMDELSREINFTIVNLDNASYERPAFDVEIFDNQQNRIYADTLTLETGLAEKTQYGNIEAENGQNEMDLFLVFEPIEPNIYFVKISPRTANETFPSSKAEFRILTLFFWDDCENQNLDLSENQLDWVPNDSHWWLVNPRDYGLGYAHSTSKVYYFSTVDGEYQSDADRGIVTPDQFDRDGGGLRYHQDIAIDLRNAIDPFLEFFVQHDLGDGDEFMVQVNTEFDSDGEPSEADWTTLKSYTGKTLGWKSDWKRKTIDLSSYSGERIWLQFRVLANGDTKVGEGVILDDIAVLGNEYRNNLVIEADLPPVFSLGQDITFDITVENKGKFEQPRSIVEVQIVDNEGETVWPAAGFPINHTRSQGLDPKDSFTINFGSGNWADWKWGNIASQGNYTLQLYCSGSTGGGHIRDENPTDNFLNISFAMDQPPIAYILQLPDIIHSGVPVEVEGWGSAAHGPISGYQWLSSVAGIIGDKPNDTLELQNPGEQTISFRVKDSRGMWSNWVSRNIKVNAIPTAEMIPIKNVTKTELTRNEWFQCEGSGEDPDGTIQAYRWSSTIQGIIGTQQDLNTQNLKAGTHGITFSVQDNDGAWSPVDSLLVRVLGGPTATLESYSIGGLTTTVSQTPFLSLEFTDGAYELAVGDLFAELAPNKVYFKLYTPGGSWIAIEPVSRIYGYFPNEGKGVVFADNNFDGLVNRGDVFTLNTSTTGNGYVNHVADLEGFIFALSVQKAKSWVVHSITLDSGNDPLQMRSYFKILDLTVFGADRVKLVGTGFDPDGEIVSSRWVPEDSGNVSDFHKYTVSKANGDYQEFRFEVMDDDGLSGQWVTVNVTFEGGPLVDAGNRMELAVDEEAQFKGTTTIAASRVVSYQWDFEGDGIFDWSSNTSGYTTHSYSVSGTYYADFKVTDDEGNSYTDTVTVVVEDEEPAPAPALWMVLLLVVVLVGLRRKDRGQT